MDVARFAESTGGDQNNIYQHAWRYRDYIIDSFNADKPFDQFIREQIDTTTRAFLATTVACARCHEHKFDPIPQQDYYALAGIFRNTTTHYGLLSAQARQATTLLDLTGLGPPPGTPTLSDADLKKLIAERDAAREALDEAMRKIRSGENVFRGALRRMRSQRDETEAALLAYSEAGEPRVFAMGTQDRDADTNTAAAAR